MGLTFGFYIKDTLYGGCKYTELAETRTDDHISHSFSRFSEDLYKHSCQRCRFNVMKYCDGCWQSTGVRIFLEWADVTMPELSRLFRQYYPETRKNAVLRIIEKKLDDWLFNDRSLYVRFIDCLPLPAFHLYSAFTNFFWRDSPIILSPERIQSLVRAAHFGLGRHDCYLRRLERWFLTFALEGIRSQIPIIIQY